MKVETPIQLAVLVGLGVLAYVVIRGPKAIISDIGEAVADGAGAVVDGAADVIQGRSDQGESDFFNMVLFQVSGPGGQRLVTATAAEKVFITRVYRGDIDMPWYYWHWNFELQGARLWKQAMWTAAAIFANRQRGEPLPT